MFCKVGAPGYVSNAVFGVVVNVATMCGILSIDKVIIWMFLHFIMTYADMR